MPSLNRLAIPEKPRAPDEINSIRDAEKYYRTERKPRVGNLYNSHPQALENANENKFKDDKFSHSYGKNVVPKGAFMVPKDHDLIKDPQKNSKKRRYSEYHLEDIQRTPRENQGYKRKSNERYNRYREDYYAKYIQPYPFCLSNSPIPHPTITRTQAAKMQELKTLRKELARLKAKNMRHHLGED